MIEFRKLLYPGNFYPRSPCGERRMYHIVDRVRACISIHALLAESDTAFCVDCLKSIYFYPRSPCGERPTFCAILNATKRISIHALLAESDIPYLYILCNTNVRFYPRSPCGERPRITRYKRNHTRFYPRSPCGERLDQNYNRYEKYQVSIHALLAESDANAR